MYIQVYFKQKIYRQKFIIKSFDKKTPAFFEKSCVTTQKNALLC